MGAFKLVLFAFIFSFNLSWSQNIVGKEYTMVDADNIYGPVITSVQISSNFLISLTNSTVNFIMFRINNGNLIILGDNRKSLHPSGIKISPQDEMRVFSVSLLKKLISDGNETNTKIEIRNNNILTLTNGNYTLEMSWPCPPTCD
ncbi:MAG: hypothetical protein P4L35_09105 [Ignavibacteriaceae bacterium]|nr:hypothetical protein [Ignavibacteriaceae bacterium]